MNEKMEEIPVKLLYEDEVYAIQGAIYEVYKEMGCGFLEAVYQECLEREFKIRKIPFETQKEIILTYKGEKLEKTYMPDFVCYGKIIIEIKAVSNIKPENWAQLFNYLKASEMKLGLLVNFGHYPKVTIKRIIL